ncbi:MAG: hypothetical protein ACYS8X_08125 [Planctomycetota bacterium]|jgi:hypothetical protein
MADLHLATDDGLTVDYDTLNAAVTSLTLGDESLAAPSAPSGFYAQDVAAGSAACAFVDGQCGELGLTLDADIRAEGNSIRVSGKVADIRQTDRAITLTFALPIDATGWLWHDDVRHARAIEAGGQYANTVDIHTGVDGTMSQYPFGCVSNDAHGLAIAMDMDVPAQFRIVYDAPARQFLIAYDVGLAQETDAFPGAAPFSFVIYRTEPSWGFRSAAQKLYDIFPEHFICRSKDQGIWMAFTDISTVQGWKDFGFKYHEGISDLEFDNASGILAFRYTEPSTLWMPMDPDIERTRENVMALLHRHAEDEEANLHREARAVLTSGMFDSNGQLEYQVHDKPWCNGVVFSTTPNPRIPGDSEGRLIWNKEVKRAFYGPGAWGIQDGEYLDSLEGYVTAEANYRREHFHYVTVPLTFSLAERTPVIHKASGIHELTKALGDELHADGKLLFANDSPNRFAFLCPHLDVLGIEVEWIDHDGDWQGPADEWMNFKRLMCRHKPYVFLLCTHFDRCRPEAMAAYFQRCLFYGMFPSMFSHNACDKPYWGRSDLYDRDRPLFKRYMPIIKRVAEAGWEPITHATTNNDAVYVERFGPNEDGHVYLTLLNTSSDPQDVRVAVCANELGLGSPTVARDVLAEENIELSASDGTLAAEVQLKAEEARLLALSLEAR